MVNAKCQMCGTEEGSVSRDILGRACHKGHTRKGGIGLGFVREQALEIPKRIACMYWAYL